MARENWRWDRLSEYQAAGVTCVICNEWFSQTGQAPKAVGSAILSGRPVFACAGSCVEQALARVKGCRFDGLPGVGEQC